MPRDGDGVFTLAHDLVADKEAVPPVPPSAERFQEILDDIASQINDLEPASDITAQLAGKANQADVDAALELKADASDLAAKADTSAVNDALALKADASDLAAKANASDVTTALGLKANASDVTTALAGKVDTSALGSTVATLTGGYLSTSQIPPSITSPFRYKGTWNAETNATSPVGGGSAGILASGVGTEGDLWRVSVAGTTSLDGNANWNVGDELYFGGGVWNPLGSSVGTSQSDGRIVGFFGNPGGQSGVSLRGFWTADNRIFQVGLGTSSGNGDETGSNNWLPIQIPWDATIGISSVVTGLASHYLIDENGAVWSWGDNGAGQLGHGDTTDRARPKKITALDGIVIAEVIPSVVNGGNYAVAFFREATSGGTGRVWGCGHGANYVFGNSSTSNQSTPVRVGTLTNVVEIAFANNYAPAFFRTSEPGIYVTGGLSGRANGLGTGAAAQTPTRLTTLDNEGIFKMAVGGGSTEAVAVMLKGTGAPLICGTGTYGLGFGDTTSLTAFTEITSRPSSEVYDDVAVVGGSCLVAFRSTVGNLHLLGYGGTGVRGNGSTSDMTSIVKPTGAFQGDVDEIAAGGPDGNQIVAVRCGNVLWACGDENVGQSGQGVYNRAAADRVWGEVVGLDGIISSWGFNGAAATAGLTVVLADGRVKACGGNSVGETGTQPGNLHAVTTLQPVHGLPAVAAMPDATVAAETAKTAAETAQAASEAAQAASEAARDTAMASAASAVVNAASAEASAIDAAASAASSAGANIASYAGTSATSLAVPSAGASVTLTTQADKLWAAGQELTVASSGSTASFKMSVSSYSGTTLIGTVTGTPTGSGTHTDWLIGAASSGVLTVAGRTGNVTLAAADVSNDLAVIVTSVDAVSLTEGAGSVYPAAYRSVEWESGTTYVVAVDAKRGARKILRIFCNGGNVINATFDLLAGMVGGTGAEISALGNDWYRCKVTKAAETTGSANLQLQIYDLAHPYSGDGVSELYVRNVDIRASGSTTPIISALPTDGGWSKADITAASVTLAQSAASARFDALDRQINGTMTADKFIEGSGSVYPSVYTTVESINGTAYVAIVDAKAGERHRLNIYYSPCAIDATFDLAAGSCAGTGASIAGLGDGWYRCTVAGIASVSLSSNLQLRVYPTNGGQPYAGDNASGLYVNSASFKAAGVEKTPATFAAWSKDGVSVSADQALFPGVAQAMAGVLNPAKPWAGKKWAALGSSITAQGQYTEPLATALGATLTNLGVSGGSLGQSSVGHYGSLAIYNAIASIPTDADLVTLESGCNDFGDGVVLLGALGDTTTATFYGALYAAVVAIAARAPNARIVLTTPHSAGSAVTNYTSLHTRAGDSATLRQFQQAIRDVGHWLGVAVIDYGGEAGINYWTAATFTSDGLHPNSTGGTLIAEYMAERIKALTVLA